MMHSKLEIVPPRMTNLAFRVRAPRASLMALEILVSVWHPFCEKTAPLRVPSSDLSQMDSLALSLDGKVIKGRPHQLCSHA